jgi:hypothetical protein
MAMPASPIASATAKKLILVLIHHLKFPRAGHRPEGGCKGSEESLGMETIGASRAIDNR